MVDEHRTAPRQRADDLEAIERLAAIGTWHLDLRTGENTWSAGLYRLMGEPETFVPDTENRLRRMHPDDRHIMEEARAAIDRGGPFRFRYRVVHPNGSVRWVLNTAEPIRDEDGALIAYIGVVRDVTRDGVPQRD